MTGGFGTTSAAPTGFGQQTTTQPSGFGSQTFGSGGFGSQPSAPTFGSSTTGQSSFGGFGFGQQKPATGFGSSFGQQAGPSTSTGFSGFGLGGSQMQQPQQQQQQPSGGFGMSAMQPTQQQGMGSSFGGFGSSSTFGSSAPTSTFGSGFGTSAFGAQPSQAPGSGLAFGQQAQQQQQLSTGFGSFGQMAGGMTQGSLNALPSRGFAFPKLLDKEGDTQATRLYYYDIHTHNRYSGLTPGTSAFSPEEVRWADMQQVQGQQPSQPGAFGAFGSTAATGTAPGTSSFGSAFGAQPSTGAAPFGQTMGTQQQQQPTTAFGTLSSFNQPAKPAGFSFGSAPSTGFGGFGSTTTQPSTATGTTGFGGFGQTQPAQQTQPTSTFGSSFGATTSTPAFGTGSTFGSGFGSTQITATQPQQTSFSFSLGGAPSTTTQPSTTGFGASSTSTTGGFGSTAFGTTAAKPATTTPSFSFGGFGSTQPSTTQPSATTTAPSFGGFGSFGSTQPSTTQQTTLPPAFSLGGQTQQGTAAPSFGGFGATAPTTTGFKGFSFSSSPTPSFGGFGTTTTGAAPVTTGFGLQLAQQQPQQQYNVNYVSDPFKINSLSAVPGSWLAPKPGDEQKTSEKIQEVAKKLHEGVAQREKAATYTTASAIGSDLDALSANILATDVQNKDVLPSVPRLVSRTASIVKQTGLAPKKKMAAVTGSKTGGAGDKSQFTSSLQTNSTVQNVLDSTSLNVTFLNQTHLPSKSVSGSVAQDSTQFEDTFAKQRSLYEFGASSPLPKEPIDKHLNLTEVLLQPIAVKIQKSTVANMITSYTFKSALFQYVTSLGNLLKRDGMDQKPQGSDKSAVSISFSFPSNLEMLRLVQSERIHLAEELPALNLVTPNTVASSLSHQLVLAALNAFVSVTVTVDPHSVSPAQLKLLALTRRRELARRLLEEFRKYLIHYQQMTLSQLDPTSMEASQSLINHLSPEHIFSILRTVCPISRGELEVSSGHYSPAFALMPEYVSLLHNGCILETDETPGFAASEAEQESLLDLGIADKSTIILAYAGPPVQAYDDQDEESPGADGSVPHSAPVTPPGEDAAPSLEEAEASPRHVQSAYSTLQSQQSYLPTLPNLKDGYQVSPHPLILARMSPEELQAVPNFQVARMDFGTIEWLEPVDLVGVRLDQDVQISAGLVEVYSSPAWEELKKVKPLVGTKLNKPARITMLYTEEDIVALARQEAEEAGLSSDTVPDSLTIEECNQVLVKYCQEYDAEHIEWNPNTSEWTFNVAHF